MKAELQNYLSEKFGKNIEIEKPYSIGGKVHIRFELGGDFKNGTMKRVNQATERAFTLFNELFKNSENEVWILAYEYLEENPFGATNEYFKNQFLKDNFTSFYNDIQSIYSGNFINENSIEIEEKIEARIIIGKLRISELNIKNILAGIANGEMGFEPAIAQHIFFIDSNSAKIFYMYDDRGCLISADNADLIRDLYEKRNHWIVEYHRSEIEKYFEQ